MRRIWAAMLCLMLALAGGCAGAQEQWRTLQPRPLPENPVAENPYMGRGDNSIHNDVYASDVTDAVAPLGIYSRVTASLETQNIHAPSAAFYDSRGNAVTPFLGGISIVSFDGEQVQRLGSFVPQRDDGAGYAFQISYSFVDANDNVVAPTSHGHILVMRTLDQDGQVLPVFEKLADIDVMAAAARILGEEVGQNLLSIVYDYQGNLWFVTGGFRIYPQRDPAGLIGYISSEYMALAGSPEAPDLDEHIFLYPLDRGEGAENGIAANEDGAVILTNLACYMLAAQDGVQVIWRTPYESAGANDALPESGYTGGGLSWGSGTSPTLTGDLVIFTDNLDPVNLIAVSSETGQIVAQTPILDGVAGAPVSVENSILVYGWQDGSASVVVANWFGAGNAGLSEPGADSSIQSYDNIYDANWMQKGNQYIAPGVERVDFVKTQQGYEARRVWSRNDVRETAMIKLSTATGYLYGYWQDSQGGWRFEALDFDTGETLYGAGVSAMAGYNNLAVGLIADPRGNALYCPTNCMEMVCWRDETAYLPHSPVKALPLSGMERYRLSSRQLGQEWEAASYLNRVSIPNLRQQAVLAVRLNGLEAAPQDYTLMYQDAQGQFHPYEGEWTLCADGGEPLDAARPLEPQALYEVRFAVEDGGALDIDEVQYQVKVAVVLTQLPS